MSCQLKLSTPQSRSIPWRSLLKFKYVIYHISPSKMAHSSHATKGARTAENLACYATQNHTGMGTKLSTLASLPLPLWPSSKEESGSIGGTLAPPTLAVPRLLLVDARDLPACIPSYPFKQDTMVPSRIRRQPVLIKAPGNWKELQPAEAGHACQLLHMVRNVTNWSASPDLHVVRNITNWSVLATWFVSLIHLQWAFLSQLYTCLNFTDVSLPSLEIFPCLPNKGKSGKTRGTLHHFSCRVQLPPPSLLYDLASTYDASSHHLHHLQHKSYLASACNPSACSALTAEVIGKKEREKEWGGGGERERKNNVQSALH